MIPMRYCAFPTGLYDAKEWDAEHFNPHQLRRGNRSCALFPEWWQWLRRLSPDTIGDPVSLRASVSYDSPNDFEGNANALPSAALTTSSSASVATTPRVVTLSLSPVEATLAVCVALRYFFAHALAIPAPARQSLHLGPAPSPLAEAYMATLPLRELLAFGVESVYSGSSAMEVEVHACMEQLSFNVRDCVLSYASNDEYRLLDENPSTFDAVLLASLYAVRARVLPLPLLTGSDPRTDRTVKVVAPVLDALNHHRAPYCTAAGVVSLPAQAVVLRAVRGIRPGEEVTVDYRLAEGPHDQQRGAPKNHEVLSDDWFGPRYMLDETRN